MPPNPKRPKLITINDNDGTSDWPIKIDNSPPKKKPSSGATRFPSILANLRGTSSFPIEILETQTIQLDPLDTKYLPTEIGLTILSFLSVHDICRASQVRSTIHKLSLISSFKVSNNWKIMCEDPKLWKRFYKRKGWTRSHITDTSENKANWKSYYEAKAIQMQNWYLNRYSEFSFLASSPSWIYLFHQRFLAALELGFYDATLKIYDLDATQNSNFTEIAPAGTSNLRLNTKKQARVSSTYSTPFKVFNQAIISQKSILLLLGDQMIHGLRIERDGTLSILYMINLPNSKFTIDSFQLTLLL
jgi:hypothetical protein